MGTPSRFRCRLLAGLSLTRRSMQRNSTPDGHDPEAHETGKARHMETLSIRDLRGARLRESARRGRPLAITTHRVLIGVFVPVASAWVEHLIESNWSQVQQSIA